MKFRFRPSLTPRRLCAPDQKRKTLKLKGYGTLRKKECKALVKNYSADAFGSFTPNKRINIISRIRARMKAFSAKLKWRITISLSKEPKVPLSTLVKVLFTTIGVTILSGVFVILSFFGSYRSSYTEVRIPDFTSMTLEQATSVSSDIFEYDTVYVSNPEYDGGSIISQNPSVGVLRKIYSRNKKLKITLTINKENEYLTLPELSGKPLREALLTLRAEGIKTRVIKEYSQSVPSGNIISASQSAGEKIKKGDTLTLKVSLGREILTVSVPSLIGKSEQEAISTLQSKGLVAGNIEYCASQERLGTVISQSISAGSSVLEGSSISLSISRGPYYSFDN